MVIEPLSSIHVSNLQPKNPPRRSFSEYFYTKEIIAGRIRGELLLHQTEIKTDECIVNALGIFFKPSHSQIEISLGLVAAPVRVPPGAATQDRIAATCRVPRRTARRSGRSRGRRPAAIDAR